MADGYGVDPLKVIEKMTLRAGQDRQALTIAECAIDDLQTQVTQLNMEIAELKSGRIQPEN